MGELVASRQTIERQADRIGELERENGRITAERDAERIMHASTEAQHAAILAAQSAPASVEPSVPGWWRWWLLALGVAGLALAVLLLLLLR